MPEFNHRSSQAKPGPLRKEAKEQPDQQAAQGQGRAFTVLFTNSVMAYIDGRLNLSFPF
jgi:predicted alpha/beta superfamily hydrolase